MNKITHNGLCHHDYGFKQRARYDRHKKQSVQDGDDEVQRRPVKRHSYNRNTDLGLFDYTPLYNFLIKSDGKPWADIWRECQERLNTTDPVFNIVVNVNRSGGVIDDYGNPVHRFREHPYIRPYGDGEAEINGVWYPKAVRVGEGTRYSAMYVDGDGVLRKVDKDYVPAPQYEGERRWGETFNGKRYDTYNHKEPKHTRERAQAREIAKKMIDHILHINGIVSRNSPVSEFRHYGYWLDNLSLSLENPVEKLGNDFFSDRFIEDFTTGDEADVKKCLAENPSLETVHKILEQYFERVW